MTLWLIPGKFFRVNPVRSSVIYTRFSFLLITYLSNLDCLPQSFICAYAGEILCTASLWRREYDEERKDRQVRVTGKEALFCNWRCGRRTFRIAYAFQKRYPIPTLKPFIFVEEMLLPSYPTSTTIFSSGFICTPAPQANPVFLEEILLEKESPSWVACSLNVAFTVPTPASAYNEKLSDNR